MKKGLMICLLIAGTTMYAQPPRGVGERDPGHDKKELIKDLSPQQRAELKTKRMVLHLDLSKAQQDKLMKLNLEIAQGREDNKPDPEKREKLSSDELFNRASARLDEKIATKKKLKEILTKEQFEKFEKSHQKRSGEMRQARRGKKRK